MSVKQKFLINQIKSYGLRNRMMTKRKIAFITGANRCIGNRRSSITIQGVQGRSIL
jgi:hypothetical protein